MGRTFIKKIVTKIIMETGANYEPLDQVVNIYLFLFHMWYTKTSYLARGARVFVCVPHVCSTFDRSWVSD